MASISTDAAGNRTIQFVADNGKRRSVRLGKVNMKLAQEIKIKVESLRAAQQSKLPLDGETARWVGALEGTLADRLAAAGLIEAKAATTLAAFVADYLRLKTPSIKPQTMVMFRQVERHLIEHFGADRPLRNITPGDGEELRLCLQAKGLAENSIRKRCQRAKQIFGFAVKKRLMTENPLDGIPTTVTANPEKFFFVTVEATQRLLESAPDAQWRLLIALARFGGVRTPSESLLLRWGDIDWAENRLTITSPKTEHHAGGASRVVPLFPEVRPYLEEVFEQAKPGEEYVFTRYSRKYHNLLTQFIRVIKRAGLTPWRKPWQNMRSSRQTELAERYPNHIVCRWLGNSVAVANKHYLQVRDSDFQHAANQPSALPRGGAESGAVKSGNGPRSSASLLVGPTEKAGITGRCDSTQIFTAKEIDPYGI